MASSRGSIVSSKPPRQRRAVSGQSATSKPWSTCSQANSVSCCQTEIVATHANPRRTENLELCIKWLGPRSPRGLRSIFGFHPYRPCLQKTQSPITNPLTFTDTPNRTGGRKQAPHHRLNCETPIWHQNASALLVSSFGWWRHANLIVGISLLERTEMLEDVKRHLEGRPCDLHMRSPAAQLLIA